MRKQWSSLSEGILGLFIMNIPMNQSIIMFPYWILKMAGEP